MQFSLMKKMTVLSCYYAWRICCMPANHTQAYITIASDDKFIRVRRTHTYLYKKTKYAYVCTRAPVPLPKKSHTKARRKAHMWAPAATTSRSSAAARETRLCIRIMTSVYVLKNRMFHLVRFSSLAFYVLLIIFLIKNCFLVFKLLSRINILV